MVVGVFEGVLSKHLALSVLVDFNKVGECALNFIRALLVNRM